MNDQGSLPWCMAGLLAFDVIGGVVANNLDSCKRFYQSAPKTGEPAYSAFLKNHLAFSALHIHTVLVTALFSPAHYFYGIFWYVFLLAGSLVILKTSLYLRRPLAFLLISVAFLLNMDVISPIPGFEWLVPALMLKILYGHLVREEPYRPAPGAGRA